MKLKNLIFTHGIDKINTFTKYPSILTLHKLDNRGKLTDELTTEVNLEDFSASEKVDGTNVRIICWGDEYLIGSRKELLTYSTDVCRNGALGIVDQIRLLQAIPSDLDRLTVIYGELYGGNIGKAGRQYGSKSDYGFRVFDVVMINEFDILNKNTHQISNFRESSCPLNGLKYGHKFLSKRELIAFCMDYGFSQVPSLDVNLEGLDHQSVLNYLNEQLPKTRVSLNENAMMKSEGLVIRNHDRSKILKLRFDDYKRILK